MIAHHRSTLISALLGAGIVLLYLWARAAYAEADDPPPLVVDAGSLDRAALIAPVDAGQAMPAPPSVEPASVGDGLDLASWIWTRFRNGQAGAGLIVALQALGLLAVRRWAWVSARLPRLVRGKALAAVSSLTGALATLVPLAVAGAPIVTPLVGAVIAAIGVYLYPTPTQIAGQTVPSGEAVPT